MSPLPVSAKLTFEDYCCFPEDGKRHEIIDGEHFMTPAPSLVHQRISMNLSFHLRAFLEEQPLGELFAAPVDVVLSDVDVVQPDLVFVSQQRRELLTEAHVRGAPDLVVEILSESTRRTDLLVKRKLYGRFGVLEYWVVDPVVETVAVYRSKGTPGGELRRAAERSLEEGDQLDSPVLPGFSLPLAELFRH